MKIDRVLENILLKLKSSYGCHTAILYGSRARGDFTARSDYDVLGVSRFVDDVVRDARKFQGKYVDAFIYPEVSIKRPTEALLYMKDGIVLFEQNNIGTRLLEKLAVIEARGPAKLKKFEIDVKRTWAQKMLERTQTADAEGHYRRQWLIVSLLPDYFALRGRWYFGSKRGLADLHSSDPKTYQLYLRSLELPHDNRNLKALVRRVLAVPAVQ